MKIYARVQGKLAVWNSTEIDPDIARKDVIKDIEETYLPEIVAKAHPVLAVIE
jgi:hypothetical protein